MRPTRKLVWMACLPLALSLAAAFWPGLLPLWGYGSIAFLLLMAWDMVLLLRTRPPELTRQVEHALPLAVWTRVKLRVSNLSSRRITVVVHDFHPAGMPVSGLPFEATIDAESWYETVYKLRPLARGAFHFDAGQLLLTSPYGWWRSSLRLGEAQDIRVYPNFQAVSKYTLLASSNQLNQIGIHRLRKRGEGREFHQMRDYVLGDALHQIDWKATSRKNKLISREFRDERDQQVVFLIDCGQSMRAQDGELCHFDHALNAVLLLANVALRHGDGTGVMTFSGPRRWLAPRKGRSQLNLILNHLYDIQPGMETADFLSAAQDVLTHLRKRSLVVLVTNLKDEDSDELEPALRLLRRKHLVLLASLRERVLQETCEQPVDDFVDALKVSATHVYLERRREIFDNLKCKGALAVDVVPERLPVAMVNSYLEIKSRGLL